MRSGALRARILTALVIAPPVLALMFFAPPVVFEGLVAAAVIGGAWEWTLLMNCTSRRDRVGYTALVALLVVAVAVWMHFDSHAFKALIGIALAWWLYVLGWLALRPQQQPSRRAGLVKGLCGLLTLVPTFAAISALHGWDELGPWRVLFLLALVWLADIGAYFFGRAFGRHKLAPQVSPGKTWEGVGGAFICAVLVIVVGGYAGLGFGPAWYFTTLCLLTVAMSVVGDLAESMFKRQHGVKDSGTLLPGHGGLLDRIDSLTAAAPLFVAGMLWSA